MALIRERIAQWSASRIARGDLAICYGYQRFDTTAMAIVIVILIALVTVVQAVGDRVVRRLRER